MQKRRLFQIQSVRSFEGLELEANQLEANESGYSPTVLPEDSFSLKQ